MLQPKFRDDPRLGSRERSLAPLEPHLLTGGATPGLDQKSRGAKSFRSRRQVCHSWSVPGDS